MKHLLTLTLVAILGFAVVGCNKTSKVNASATAAQCDPADCAKAGTEGCPMAAAKAAKAKPAAAGGCDPAACAAKANCNPASCGSKTKPAAANATYCPLEGTPECPMAAAKAAKAKPAATGKSSCCSSKK